MGLETLELIQLIDIYLKRKTYKSMRFSLLFYGYKYSYL